MPPVRFRTWVSLLASLGLAAVLLVVLAAWAQDRRPPAARLHVAGTVRTLHPWSVHWTRRRGNRCVVENSDGVPTFRPRVAVNRKRARPKVVFEKGQRPRRVTAYASRHLVNGYLARAHRVKIRLRRHGSGRERSWVAKMRVKVRRRAFVAVVAAWRDQEGCHTRERASWSFSLVRR
jgi:hypothetical protein